MKKIIVGIAVLTLLSWGVWAALRPSTEPVPITSTLETYTDPEGVFSFRYPKAWSVTGRDGAVLAKVSVPRSYLPNTNFSEAWLTVNWSNASSSISTCIGTATSSDAAAGNRYDTTTVKKIYDGDCYTLEYTIHYSNIQNYDPNQGIQEFDEAKLKSELDAVVDSFRYLVNSD